MYHVHDICVTLCYTKVVAYVTCPSLETFLHDTFKAASQLQKVRLSKWNNKTNEVIFQKF
jgi:hypothetical protein